MGNISSAVDQNLISRVVGYQLTSGQQTITSANLPMRIAMLGPANNANQASLGSTPTPTIITSASEASSLYGAGSPIHQMARILYPISGSGIGGIPLVVYPQLEASGATATTLSIDVTGTPTRNISHRLVINGRDNIDGIVYEFNVLTTDDAAAIRTKMINAINAVTNSPISASEVLTKVQIQTKWRGSTSAELNVAVDTREDAAGLTYTTTDRVDGIGTDSITTALSQFDQNWNTVVINPYGVDKFDELETFNGAPLQTNPTGRYDGIVFKPFVALWGSTESSRTAIEAITGASARRSEVTNVLCPAPNSQGFPWEAAANVAYIIATIAQNNPHVAYGSQSYTDMPIPDDEVIGDMSQYVNRNSLATNGASTVELVDGAYQIQELVTTYRPEGESVPAYRYVRDLIVHWNIRYGYLLIELRVVRDKTITSDDATVTATGVVKPKEWKAEVFDYADNLELRALISDAETMKDSVVVGIGSTNPNRLETSFSYNTTGTVRIASTTAEANFSF